MLKRQRVLFHWSFVAVDLFAVAATGWVARHLQFGPLEEGTEPLLQIGGLAVRPEVFVPTHWNSWEDLAKVGLLVLAWALLAPRFDLYRSRRTESVSGEAWAITQLWVVAFALATLGMVFLWSESRVMPAVLLLTPVVLIGMRFLLRTFLHRARAHGRNFRDALIVGEGGLAREVNRILASNPQFGVRVAGSVSFAGDDEEPNPSVLPCLGRTRDLEKILAVKQVDSVVVCPASTATGNAVERVFRLCDEAGIPCHLAPAFLDLANLRPTVTRLGDLPLLSFEVVRGPSASLAVKRLIDVVFASAALILFAPALAFIAVMIRWQDGGPAIFSQVRVGRHGRQFRLYKFRTMTIDAEAQRQALAARNEVDGPVFKIQRDPRITPFGRLLRKYSLDELPQLFNVVRGEMSLVGPRPPIQAEVDQYAWWQRRRLSVKPGLTCIWQVSGRNDVSFEHWMKMDLAYIDSWSLTLDFKLMLQTFRAVLRGTGC